MSSTQWVLFSDYSEHHSPHQRLMIDQQPLDLPVCRFSSEFFDFRSLSSSLRSLTSVSFVGNSFVVNLASWFSPFPIWLSLLFATTSFDARLFTVLIDGWLSFDEIRLSFASLLASVLMFELIRSPNTFLVSPFRCLLNLKRSEFKLNLRVSSWSSNESSYP